ncbi:nucleolar protein 14 homolog [Lutzomyia longipalpis]|uniref:nucleolar protein 14 homolog n=1 Tax=Lutzomyia longipalpis TaxID=7200 RepID=UPI00248416D6|nr:nucleolar protein 14 homolog [Lutzomyia longipalpis]
MGKKAKKRGIADAVYTKKAAPVAKKANPFENHVNRTKYAVLNRKTNHERGIPGVARQRAFDKRKATLGVELMKQNKSNSFRDRRIGGPEGGDEAMRARFVAEMKSLYGQKSGQSKRKRLFNLNEEDTLTHKGQTIESIEKGDDAPSDRDEDSEEEGALDAKYTELAHFGGGGEAGGVKLGGKEALEEMIAETKRRKAEIAREKDAVQTMTEKLDRDWRDLIPLIGKLSRGDQDERAKPDAYDRTMREMIFEARGEPTDKLKSLAEIEKEEREKREKLERARLARMQAATKKDKIPNHRSVDDLDDGYTTIAAHEEAPEGLEALEAPEELQKKLPGEEDDSEESSSDDESAEEIEKILPKLNQEFSFDFPQSYEDFLELLAGDDEGERLTALVANSHPHLQPENKEKTPILFSFLLQRINDAFSEISRTSAKISWKILSQITPHLYDLLHLNQLECVQLFQAVLREKQEEFRARKSVFPGMDTLIFLKLIPLLFSTSDFRHSVATPAFIFISQILTHCEFQRRTDFARALLLISTILEFTNLSKRFLPAVTVCLTQILALCIPRRAVEVIKLIPPFKKEMRMSLVLDEEPPKVPERELKMTSEDLIETKVTQSFRVRLLHVTLGLCRCFLEQQMASPGAKYTADDIEGHLERIPLEKYPEETQKLAQMVKDQIKGIAERPMNFLVPPKKLSAVPQLRQIDPKINDTTFTDRRRKQVQDAKAIQDSLRHKVKRETKSALREIRRDAEFIGKMRLKRQMQLDRERREKVKRIFAEASDQQAELNAMDRSNKRRKR